MFRVLQLLAALFSVWDDGEFEDEFGSDALHYETTYG
jgi:hypothetical protein